MLFREEIAAAKRDVKLQVFASDVDPDAVAVAREGLYPATIEADVSPERLARFFTKEDHGYRVSPELRATVVFTVQDVLADPPFSRLDLVSCRNLLIYLRPEAQAKVISLFHFALREGGVLLLGTSETVGDVDGRFEAISKTERLYRHIGRGRPGELRLFDGTAMACAFPSRRVKPRRRRAKPRSPTVPPPGDRSFAPAAVLINRKHECLYSLGPTDRYLRVAPGQPTHDLLAMVREGLRAKLRSAIQQASQDERANCRRRRSNDAGRRRGFVQRRRPAGVERRRRACCCLLRRRADAAQQRSRPPGRARRRGTGRRTRTGTRSDHERNSRAPSAIWRFPAKSRRRSTKKRCRSTRNSNPPTRSC